MCRALGPLQVTVDDTPAPAPVLWRPGLGMLVYLLRSPRRTRSREHLVGLLWPDVADRDARHSLSEALSKLRRAVGDDAVETTGEHVTLGPRFRIDVEDFEAAMLRHDWAAAAGLCVGEFAEGLTVPGALDFDQWLELERRHWRSQGVLALSSWAERLLEQGRTSAAMDAARRALVLDPLSDRATRTVMRAQLLLGDRRGALETGRALTARLASELGTAPEAETTALIAQAGNAARTSGNGRPQELNAIPLVGRERELSALLGLYQRARSTPEATLAIVVGDPGTGVSRLLVELAARAGLDSASVSRVVAVEADGSEAWSGICGLALGGLLGAPGIAAAPASSLSTLASRLVPWRDRFDVTDTVAESLELAFAEVVAAAADERPVVLVLDDAHRLDEETLRALPRMLRRWRELPVLVAVGLAPLHERPAIDDLRSAAGRDVPGATLAIGPLTLSAIRELAAGVLPNYTAAELDRVVRRTVMDSAGLPLLAVELLRAVSRGLELGGARRAWPATAATLEDSLPSDLPDVMVAALRVNFRLLSRGARDVLSAAAVLADRVSASDLVRATGMSRADVDAALDELEWHHWLSAEGRGYSFVARLYRRVIGDEMLTPGQRRRILDRMQATEH